MWFRKIISNWVYVELACNVLIPTIGIFFFKWGIGNVFWMFFLELLLIGVFTCLKILFATKEGSFFSRLGRTLGFILGFFTLFLLIMILAGNFGHGETGAFDLHISKITFYSVVGNYVFGFLIGFIGSGKFKRVDYRKIARDTLWRLTALFFLLLIILLPFSFMVKYQSINYVMAIGIVITKNVVDYHLGQKKEIEKPTL